MGRWDGQQNGEMGWFVNLTSPLAHTPLRQLADFLQRGRCDGLTINIPPAPFKGGEVTVSRTGRGDGQ